MDVVKRRLPGSLSLLAALLAAAAVLGWTAWMLGPPEPVEEISPEGVVREGWVEVTFPGAVFPGRSGGVALDVQDESTYLVRSRLSELPRPRWDVGPVLVTAETSVLTAVVHQAEPQIESFPGVGAVLPDPAATWTLLPWGVDEPSRLQRGVGISASLKRRGQGPQSMADLHFQRRLDRALESTQAARQLAAELSRSGGATPEGRKPDEAHLLAWRVLGGGAEMAVQLMVSFPPRPEADLSRRLIPPEPRFDFQARRGADGGWSTLSVRGTTFWFPGARSLKKSAAMEFYGADPIQLTPQARESMLAAFQAWVKTHVPSP